MLKKLGLAALLSGFLLALPGFAQSSTWTIDPAHSGVEFQIKHLGVSTVRGSFSNVSGTVVWKRPNACAIACGNRY